MKPLSSGATMGERWAGPIEDPGPVGPGPGPGPGPSLSMADLKKTCPGKKHMSRIMKCVDLGVFYVSKSKITNMAPQLK